MPKQFEANMLFHNIKGIAERVRKETVAVTPLVCGYVSIVIKPARGAFVTYLKDIGVGKRGVYGGYEFSITEILDNSNNLQSVEIKRAVADKVARRLQLADVKCTVKEQLL